MKQLRKRLTYANVMSTIAVFLVLGGATAFAATKIGTNEIKAGAITTGKIKKEAITQGKVKNGAISGPKLAPGAVSASKIDTAGLVVPSATNATNATNAVNATNAANAAKVNGQTAVKIFLTIPNGTTGATIASFAGFTIRADCTGSDVNNLVLDPPNNSSNLSASGNGNETAFYESNQGAEPNELDLNDGNDRGETAFSAATSAGLVVSGNIGYEDPDSFGGLVACGFYGEVLIG